MNCHDAISELAKLYPYGDLSAATTPGDFLMHAVNEIRSSRELVRRFESECRNELVRGEIEGLAPNGPHAILWIGLRDRAQAFLKEFVP